MRSVKREQNENNNEVDRQPAGGVLFWVSFIFSLQVFMSGGGGAGVARRGGSKAGADLFRELPGE